MTYPLLPARARRGAAMLLALFFLMAASLMVSTLIPRAVFRHDESFRETRHLAALQVGEAGLERAIWNLSYDQAHAWNGWITSNPAAYFLPKTAMYDAHGHKIGEYAVRIKDPLPLGQTIMLGAAGNFWPLPLTANAEPTITAVAGAPDLFSPDSERRIVQVVARSRSVFSLGLFSDKTLDLGGTTGVNSYDSRKGPYHPVHNVGSNVDAGSNNNIVLNGNVLIDGDAAAGGSVMIGGKSVVTGEVEGGITRIDLPSTTQLVNAAKLNNNNNAIPPAKRPNGTNVTAYNAGDKSLNVAANATLTIPGGTADNPAVYYFSSAKLNGNSTIKFDGYVIIMSDGNLDFTGGTVINNSGTGTPGQLVIYSSGGDNTSVKINGGAGFAGAVYAPKANIAFSGGGQIFGAAVGGKITVQGNAEFHYDEALGNTGLIAYFQVNEWSERYADLSKAKSDLWSAVDGLPVGPPAPGGEQS